MHLLEENQMNASDVARLLDDASLGSKILEGEQSLTVAHLCKLAERFLAARDLNTRARFRIAHRAIQPRSRERVTRPSALALWP